MLLENLDIPKMREYGLESHQKISDFGGTPD